MLRDTLDGQNHAPVDMVNITPTVGPTGYGPPKPRYLVARSHQKKNFTILPSRRISCLNFSGGPPLESTKLHSQNAGTMRLAVYVTMKSMSK